MNRIVLPLLTLGLVACLCLAAPAAEPNADQAEAIAAIKEAGWHGLPSVKDTPEASQ